MEIQYDQSTFPTGQNTDSLDGTLILTNNDGGTAGSYGANIKFAQRWSNGNSGTNLLPLEMGAITGYNETNNNFGGGLTFWTHPTGSTPMLERMRIKSDGNVGIGTNSPSNKLTVSGGAIQLSPYASGTTNFAMYSDSDILQINPRTSGGAYNSIIGLNMSSNGNVGIGTTSLSNKLTLKSTTNYDGFVLINESDNNIVKIARDTNGGGYFNLYDSNGAVTSSINNTGNTFLNGGNVGIGTATPETPLHIKKAGTANGQVFRVSRTDPGSCWVDLECNSNNTTTDPTNPRQLWSIASHPNGNLNFYKRDGIGGNNYRMSIQGTGNVGIGTTSPYQKLQVDGNIYLGPNDSNSFIHSGATMGLSADGDIKIVADANDTSGGIQGGDIIFGGGSNVNMNANESTSFPSVYPRIEHMRIKGSGNVGIGTTSPSQKLHIAGNMKLPSNNFIYLSDNNYMRIRGTSDNEIQFYGNGNPKITMDNDGNLEVSGDVRHTIFVRQMRAGNISDLENSLEKICSIRGVNFKDDENQKHAGILPQEVDSVIPEAINKKDDEKWCVNYNTFVGYLIESVKTLKKENDNQNVKIENLESKLEAQGQHIQKLMEIIQKLMEKIDIT